MLGAGDTLNQGGYRIERQLGRGGFGIVYLATEVALGRLVAIKTLRPDLAAEEPALPEAFLSEARLTARLSHPHIVPVYFVGHEPHPGGSIRYLVMEYLAGGDLETALARGAPSLSQKLLWMRQLAEGLAYAHRQGIVHRDLKLRNSLLTAEQDVKIADFGLAKAMGAQTKTVLRATGTPYYLSPEQIQGRPTDTRSDLYAIGIMYYQLSTGRLPYDAPDIIDTTARLLAVTYQHVHAPIPSARAANPAVPPALDALVQRLMAKTPEARPASAAEVAQALAALPSPAAEPAVSHTERDVLTGFQTTRLRPGTRVPAAPPTDLAAPPGMPTTETPVPTQPIPAAEGTARPRRGRWPWLAVPALLLALAGGAFAVKVYLGAEARRSAEGQTEADPRRQAETARKAEEEQRRREAEADRQRREADARQQAEAERKRAEEEQKRLALARTKAEEEQRRREAEVKAAEARAAEARRRAEVEQRRAEEARQARLREEEARRRAEEERKRAEEARLRDERRRQEEAARPGSLAITSKVPGVEVWLEGKRVGETTAGQALIIRDLAPGSYRLRARKAGYKEWDEQVKVTANQRAEIAIDIEQLKVEPPPSKREEPSIPPAEQRPPRRDQAPVIIPPG